MAKVIVHPTDFSSASRPAFRKAMELAKKEGRQLRIVHVLQPPVLFAGDGAIPPQVYEQLDRTQRAAAQKRLDRLVAAARARGVRAEGVLREGVSHDQIARAARGAEMIVMGTHGRTGFKRLMLGSVASRVIGTAPCPVLAVRGT
jgi:nucleotide-binding universal stress UspA family protein